MASANFLGLCYIALALVFVIANPDPVFLAIATSVAFISIFLRQDPWRRRIAGLPAILPHLVLPILFALLAFDWKRSAEIAGINIAYPTFVAAYVAVPIGWALRFLYWIFVGLRADLVNAAEATEGESWLSTQPDAATYVPSAYADRVLDYIERANSGVIGVTGVRGAGKSALFKHVLQQCAARFGRLEMTAPVAYERGTQSLMTLCREMAQRVIRDVEPALQGRPSTAVLAVRDLARRVPALLVLAILGVVLAGYGAKLAYEAVLLRPQQKLIASPAPAEVRVFPDPTYPRQVRIWPSREIVEETYYFPGVLAKARESETWVIGDTLAQARRIYELTLTTAAESPSSFLKGALLAPAATRAGFALAPVSAEEFPSALSELANAWSYSDQEILDTIPLLQVFDVYDVMSPENLQDLLLFYRHVLGDSTVPAEIPDSGDLTSMAVCLQMMRGDLSLESKFAANTHSIRTLLNSNTQRGEPSKERPGPSGQNERPSDANPSGQPEDQSAVGQKPRPTQFASLLLLEAWRRQPEGVFLNEEDLGKLIVLLEEYLTLFPSTKQATEAAEETSADLPRLGFDWWMQLVREHWLPLLTAIFLVLLYPVGRSAILILRGLVNFRYVGLMREAESFLGYLAYSDSQERSAGGRSRASHLPGSAR